MSEKLGIKIEGPVRIGIEPPYDLGLPKAYSLFLVLSFSAIGLALMILVSELLDWPLSNTIYELLSQWTKGLPLNF